MEITEKTLEAFEKMDLDKLQGLAEKLNLSADGQKEELIARLAAAGYNPEAVATKLVPVLFLNVKTCDPIMKVLESIRSGKFLRMRLPRIDRFGRVQRGFVHHTIPCRPQTAKELLQSELVSSYEQFEDTFEQLKASPDDWDFTWCQVRGRDQNTGKPRYFVALHAQRKGVDVDKMIEDTKPQEI